MDAAGGHELVQRGRDALAAGDWDAARALLEQAAAEAGETGEVLSLLSDATRYAGEYERSIELGERAFAAFRAEDDVAGASEVARWLAFSYATYHGNIPAAAGWLERASGVLEGVAELPAHGGLAVDLAVLSDDPAERERYALTALGIARRFGDAALEVAAKALLGEAYVASGRIAEGMKLLDAAMAALVAGEVPDHGTAGEVCCRLLSACERASDVRRAEAWMAQIGRHVLWTDFVRPTCRTHYGGILIALGRWDEAEAELREAIGAFDRGWRGDRVFPVLRLAELRVRQGRYEEAERLLEGLEWHSRGRGAAAAIALARGDLPLAEDLARLCYEGAGPGDPACAPLLALLVAAQLGRGDAAGAAESAARLDALAGESPDERVPAFARLAAGRIAAAAGDEGATADLQQAVEGFGRLGLSLEAARAQLELAAAIADRAPQAAVAEARAALAVFERLGAQHDADLAAGLLRDLGGGTRSWPKGHGTLTKRESEVLALLADGLANAEIAERLVISRRTAEHHVASILSKLGLRSRAEAAAYAVRAGTKDT